MKYLDWMNRRSWQEFCVALCADFYWHGHGLLYFFVLFGYYLLDEKLTG